MVNVSDITSIYYLQGFFFNLCFLCGRYLQMFHIGLHGLYICLVRNRTMLHLMVTTIQVIIQVILFIIIIPNACVIGMTDWMTSEFHSRVNLEVSYMFCKFANILWLLVEVQTFLCCLYTCRIQPCLYDNKSSVWCNWLALSRNFHSGNYIVWTFVTSIYLT